MGRPKRIQFPGACYYVQLRGNNGQEIFVSDEDRRAFLSLLRGHKERFGLHVYAYCLTPREAELLLETPRGNLASAMQGFGTSYTKHFNAAHGAVGHVFQGRYRALLVDKERYLTEMTRLIHLQPLREGVKERPWRYPWSSAAAYIEARRAEPLIDAAEVLTRFGQSRHERAARYLRFLEERLRSPSDLILPIVRGVAVGSEAFLAGVESRLGQAPPPRHDTGSAARRILAEVAVAHGLPEERLLSRAQRRDAAATRRQAIHRIWKEARLSVTEVARLFGRTPSAVSQLVRGMEAAARFN